jgi:hypothetical protein
MSFVEAFALFPMAQAVHVLEEWIQGFPKWARRFASDRYTDREYAVTHALAIASAIATAFLVRTFPNRSVVFVVLAFIFGPGIACNALFHLGATLISHRYCPGVITSIVLYVPLTCWLIVLALRQGLLPPAMVTTALLLGAAFHTLEVSHNVFKRW